jgi:chemotaxis-related protein WspD
MNEAPQETSLRDDCWKRIGIYGDRSCPKLEPYVHCRNCPKYSELVGQMLDREPTAQYLEQWTRQLAQEKKVASRSTVPVTIFRLGVEWLALGTTVLEEMTEIRPIHGIPHRTNNILLGLVNVRGMLQLCVSMAHLLGIEEVEPEDPRARRAHRRLIVIHRENDRWAFPADEIHGIYRIGPGDFQNAPVTVAKAVPRFINHVFPWEGHRVGHLDDELVFRSLRRSVL